MKKVVLCVALWIMFFCVMITGCSSALNSETSHTGGNVNTVTGSSTMDGQTQTSTEEPLISRSEDIVIETKYGNLHYPDRWEEYVTISQKTVENNVNVSFTTETSGISYTLFEIVIGNESGEVVGALTDSTGTQHNVYLHVSELTSNTDISEEEETRFYAMQEDLNYLIDHLE